MLDAIQGLSACCVAEHLHAQRVVARGYMRRRDLDLLKVEAAAFNVDNVEAQAILILSAGCIGFLPVHYANPLVERGALVQLLPAHGAGFRSSPRSGAALHRHLWCAVFWPIWVCSDPRRCALAPVGSPAMCCLSPLPGSGRGTDSARTRGGSRIDALTCEEIGEQLSVHRSFGRSSRRRIFPTLDLGKALTNSTLKLGIL